VAAHPFPNWAKGWQNEGTLMSNALRPFSIAVAAAVLLMQAPYAHAQYSNSPPPKPGPSEKEKAKALDKRASAKEIDEAYKETLGKIPDVKQKVDPWAGIRTAPQK
jgi:hypothetical protein